MNWGAANENGPREALCSRRPRCLPTGERAVRAPQAETSLPIRNHRSFPTLVKSDTPSIGGTGRATGNREEVERDPPTREAAMSALMDPNVEQCSRVDL